jgi:hypothetical protein
MILELLEFVAECLDREPLARVLVLRLELPVVDENRRREIGGRKLGLLLLLLLSKERIWKREQERKLLARGGEEEENPLFVFLWGLPYGFTAE